MAEEPNPEDILKGYQDEETPVKILVRSKLKEVRAKTMRTWVEKTIDGKAHVEQVDFERQFFNNECFMSPEECVFLVESKENKAREAAGDPWYWYPAGQPYPAAVDYKVDKYGPYTAPIRSGTVSTAEPMAAEGAKQIEAERKAAIEEIERRKATTSARATAKANKDAKRED